jgi:hypothetical protein
MKSRNKALVGIFWLVGKRLVLAGTPLDQAQSYGECKNFPISHIDYWAELQRDGSVPPEMEYEEAPRGRIVYNTTTQQFTLMADRCILGNAMVVRKILSQLHLPTNTKLDTDYHYRCSRCLYGAHDYDE